MGLMGQRWLALVTAGFLAACAGQSPDGGAKAPAADEKISYHRVGYDSLPGWAGDTLAEAYPAVLKSCDQLGRMPDDRAVGPDAAAGRVSDWRAPCDQVRRAGPAGLKAVLEQQFQPYEVRSSAGGSGLFTGYYEPELNGSRRREGAFQTPLLRRPDDLVQVELADYKPEWRGERIGGRVVDGRLRPYPDRAAIEGGALTGRGLELVWVDDAVDAFFLQIQGSGRVKLTDGRIMRVGYAAQNGRPYFAIGRELIRRGVLTAETVSMQSIRAWLLANPAEAQAVMNLNPSYVFFRELQGEGPLGAMNVALTPGRSVAIDPKFIPMGVPLFFDTSLPDGTVFRRLMVAQDTGGAIRGAVRADIFWGAGDRAADLAGRMKQPGRYFMLLPKGIVPPVG